MKRYVVEGCIKKTFKKTVIAKCMEDIEDSPDIVLSDTDILYEINGNDVDIELIIEE